MRRKRILREDEIKYALENMQKMSDMKNNKLHVAVFIN